MDNREALWQKRAPDLPEHAKRWDRLMRASTTLTVSGFDELAERLDVAWTTMRAPKTAAETARQRHSGGIRKGSL